ncbi:MAG: hypothetical protein OEZ68_16015 [Gammaproteobacteria bacterium]|nr:hypothetical protein [Gammaproteobacteria bacterium]MDH5802308.1 hypothetical protein [Gammaproteobacteria bacterium]
MQKPAWMQAYDCLKGFILLVLLVGVTNVAADNLGNSIEATERLLVDSVSAKKVNSSHSAEAKEEQKKALDLLQQAKAAHQKGDSNTAKEKLTQAKRQFFAAIRLVGNGVVKNGKQRKYDHLHKSVNALLGALHEVSTQKKSQKHTRDVEQRAKDSLKQSQDLVKSGRMDEAISTIEKAYLSIKLTIKGLRDGETLVRELHFANVEEEYRYEVNRNKTHRVLVDILLTEKLKDPKFVKLMEKPLQMSEQLKQEAQQLADKGDYESALKTLEHSTAQIVRAIRAAGIYIPG